MTKSSSILVASPRYLSAHGTPTHAAELSGHFLLVDPRLRQPDTSFINLLEDGRHVRILPMSSMDGNEVLLRAAALTGAGIATLPEAMVRDDIAQGHLIPVLPGCSTSENDVEVCLFYSHRELLPARFRIFVDFCTAFFRSEHGNAEADGSAEPPQRVQRKKPALAEA